MLLVKYIYEKHDHHLQIVTIYMIERGEFLPKNTTYEAFVE